MRVYEPMDFSGVIGASVTPSFRPTLGGMDSEDAPPSVGDDGESYGKRVRGEKDRTAPLPSDEGIFISDADTGTPLDPFNMQALHRHTQRYLALMHQPVVKFAASIAQKIGKNPDGMLVNGGTLIDPNATTVRALFNSSAVTQAATAQAMAQAVVELLRAEPTPVKVEPVVEKPAKVKLESPIHEALGMVYERIGPRGIFAPDVRGFNDADTPATSILAQLAVFLSGLQEEDSVARWAWNSLPENSGIAIIRSDVVAAMEDCHAMIRESIPDVQMWHLITGPHVRGQFAIMVAEYINEAPGELQYPKYQSTRGPNVLTGTRISAGKFREERAVQRVRKSKAWFANVSYGPSESWAYAQKLVPLSHSKVEAARADVQKWLRACATLVSALWEQLVAEPVNLPLEAGGDDYSMIIGNHRIRRLRFVEAELRKELAEKNLVRGRTQGVAQAELDRRTAAVAAARQEVSDRSEEVQDDVRDLQPFLGVGMRKRLGIAAEHVYVLLLAFQEKKEENVVDALDGLIENLSTILRRVQLFTRPADQGETTTLLELMTTATSLRQAISAVKEAQRVLVKAEKDLLTFPEADKRELFHHVPQIDPAFSLPFPDPMSGIYASW